MGQKLAILNHVFTKFENVSLPSLNTFRHPCTMHDLNLHKCIDAIAVQYAGNTAGDVSSWYGSFVYAKTPDLMRSAKLPRHPTVRYEKSDSKSDTLDKMRLIKGKKTGLELGYYHENPFKNTQLK